MWELAAGLTATSQLFNHKSKMSPRNDGDILLTHLLEEASAGFHVKTLTIFEREHTLNEGNCQVDSLSKTTLNDVKC